MPDIIIYILFAVGMTWAFSPIWLEWLPKEKRCKDCIWYNKNIVPCLIHLRARGTAETCMRYEKTTTINETDLTKRCKDCKHGSGRLCRLKGLLALKTTGCSRYYSRKWWKLWRPK